MIVRSGPGALLCIPQTEHARICGDMARAWGAGRFRPPQPAGPVALAAAEHDNGWAEWEERPRFNPETGRPFSYRDIPIAQHLEIYRRGIRRAIDRDGYAGLLVSLHGSLLYERYRVGEPGAAEFIAEQRALRERLTGALKAEPELAAYCRGPVLSTNRDLLVGWDVLSLFLCHGEAWADDISFPTEPDGARAAIAVRAGPRGAEGTGSAEPRAWTLEPYPFQRRLALSVRARRLEGERFAHEADYREAWRAARSVELRFRIGGR